MSTILHGCSLASPNVSPPLLLQKCKGYALKIATTMIMPTASMRPIPRRVAIASPRLPMYS